MVVNPHSGARLRPMFVREGLTDITQETRLLELEYPAFSTVVFLEDRLGAAVECGDVTPSQVERFVASQEARHQQGTAFGYLVGYYVTGTKTGE